MDANVSGASHVLTGVRDDRILPATRIVLCAVVPFLVLAFLILYFHPEQSGERFAWAIKPPMTAVFIGAGYLGGAYQFVRLIVGRRWHRYAIAFPPVSAFTVAMLGATIVHWDRFDLRHFPFQLWLGLYVVTPFLVTGLWLANRRTDPGTAEAGDPVVPAGVRTTFGTLGVIVLAGAIAAFIAPRLAVEIWAWPLTPLTARVIAGWFALMGVGAVALACEPRWSAIRVALQSFVVWHGLVLAGAFRHREDFGARGLANGYVVVTVIGLTGMVALYIAMERRARRARDPRGG
jgi:hypothetical protein